MSEDDYETDYVNFVPRESNTCTCPKCIVYKEYKSPVLVEPMIRDLDSDSEEDISIVDTLLPLLEEIKDEHDDIYELIELLENKDSHIEEDGELSVNRQLQKLLIKYQDLRPLNLIIPSLLWELEY